MSDLVYSVIVFLSQTTLPRWLTFSLGSLAVTFAALLFWICFFWSYCLFYSGFPSIGKFWSCYCLSFYLLSINVKGGYPSLLSFWLSSCWLRWSLWSFETCSMRLSGSRLELMHIPHRKYQVKPHSSPWVSAACASSLAYRNHFFHLHQQNKSSSSQVKFRKNSNFWKQVLQAAKFAYANKTKRRITSQKLGSRDFC